jgi:alpha-1,6-mannosyltransferase
MIAWDILPIAVTWLHVWLSPYTKVEESFTLHAVHDMLAHGLWPSSIAKVS